MIPKTILTGSVAFDTITVFRGRFSDHLVPNALQALSLSVLVDRPARRRGGTAGNIAVAMRSAGGSPTLWATAGADFSSYNAALSVQGIGTDGVRCFMEEETAHAFIITDLAHAQITAFHPGAMARSAEHPVDFSQPIERIVVSASEKTAMLAHAVSARKNGVPFWFDPGQALSSFFGKEILFAAQGAEVMILNAYEWAMFGRATGIDTPTKALSLCENLIITHGEGGSERFSFDGYTKIEAVKPKTVVDPTGCGDAYRGGVLAALSAGADWVSAMKCGAEVASRCVEHEGAQWEKE